MPDLDRLLNVAQPAWPEVRSWIDAATVPVEILPVDSSARRSVLGEVGVTIGSALGAVVYETGGILVDHGWVRVRGSGHERLPRPVAEDRSWVIVAEDIVGGVFALHPPEGQVMYLAPDTLNWESMESKYSGWLRWLLSGQTGKFYEPYRGAGWENRASMLRPDQAFMLVPLPWLEGPEYPERFWKPVPVAELYPLSLDIREQLLKDPPAGV